MSFNHLILVLAILAQVRHKDLSELANSNLLHTLYPGFAGFVPSGRVAVFPECVHKPWQFGSTVFQTAMVCEVTVLPNCHGL